MLDNELTIEIPEHIELHFALASVGNRFLACAIDHIIQVLLIFSILAGARSFEVSLDVIGLSFGQNWILAGAILGVFCIVVGYFVVFETGWNGQTPGKRWLQLRVVRQDGRPISFYESMIRNLVRLVDMMPIPSYFVGIMSIFFSREYRRVGDYAAGTVVIKERSTEAPKFAHLFDEDATLDHPDLPPAIAIPTYGLKSITREEMKAVDAFLQRRARLDTQRRRLLAHRIAAPLMLRLQLPPNAGQYELFLEELFRQYTIQAKYLTK